MSYAAVVAAVAAVAGAGIGAYSAHEQGKQQQRMYEDQAQQAANDAAYKKDAAKAHAEKIRRMGELQKGEAKAALAASGVDVAEGTSLELQKSITQNAEEDALSAILGGKRAAGTAEEEARMLMTAGANAKRNGNTSAASTVIGAAGSFASGWSRTAKKTAA